MPILSHCRKSCWLFWQTTLLAACLLHAPTFAQSNAPREWTDSTGTYKIQASLIEVKEGNAFLQDSNGKTIKIPLSRLSEADQAFLKTSSNPFEVIAGDSSSMSPPKSPSNGNTEGSASASGSGQGAVANWSEDLQVDWSEVEELDFHSNDEWSLTLPPPYEFSATAKRGKLREKLNFHEDLRTMDVNPIVQRAVAGFTVSFTVPKPLSRLSLIDFASGKSIHTNPVEANMVPLCLLNDGSTVVMRGAGRDRDSLDKESELQLWKVTGKDLNRSKSWTPFPKETNQFRRQEDVKIVEAIAISDNKLLLAGSNGHIACIDAVTRKPYWHARLSSNFAVAANADRSLLAILNGQLISIIDPVKGQTKCQLSMTDKPNVALAKICWSPSGKKLLVCYSDTIRVLDLTTGEWAQQFSLPGVFAAMTSIVSPDEDYALLDGRVLVHLPSQIKVCEYLDAKQIKIIGGTSVIAIQSKEGGVVVPSKIPHPAAEKALESAEGDPNVFLIHPGVAVSIDASGAGQYASQVAELLQKGAEEAGYKVVSGSPITLVGAISGPKQEALSFIMHQSYIANVYQSTLRITWQGKDIWTTSANNIPRVVVTSRGQTVEQKLEEIGKAPSLSIFEKPRLPKMLQRPMGEAKGPNGSQTLMVSKFTMQGLVDSK